MHQQSARSTCVLHLRQILLTAAALLLAATANESARAASGTWVAASGTTAVSGTWSVPANWASGIVADGADNTADFSTLDVSGTTNVFLDTARAIGNLLFGDTDSSTPGPWVLTNNGIAANVLTLRTTSGTPTITTNADATVSVVLSGSNGLSKAGTGTLTLTEANNYSGGTTISSGTLILNTGATLGSGGLTYTSTSAATSVVFNSPQALSLLTSPQNSANTLVLSSSTTALTVNQSSNTTFGGVITGSGELIKNGSGQLTLSNSNTFTGPATVNGGTLRLDLATASGNGTAGGTIQVLRSAGTITVGGGTVTTSAGNGTGSTAYQGNFNRLVINPGASSFNQTRGSNSRAINTFSNVTRSAGGTVSLTDVLNSNGTNNANSGGYRGPTSILINGVVPYITYTTRTDGSNTNTSWFVPVGTSNNGSAYSAFTASTASALGTATQNVDVVTDVAVPAGGATINTLRFNDVTASRTVTLTGTDPLIVAAGGILVTNRVGNNTDKITGGVLLGGTAETLGTGSPSELIIINYNDPNNGANAFLQIDSTIADNGSPTVLTKSGIGTLVLTNTANTYTGKTFLNGGITNIAAGTSLGVIPVSPVADQLTFNGGTLQIASAFNLNANRGITLLANGGTFDTQANSSTYDGIITGTGAFTKAGSGSLTLTGSNNYGGGTTIASGTLRVNNATGSATGSGAITVNAGAVLSGSGAVSGAITLASGGVAGAGGHIAPGSSGVGTLTVGSITMSSNSVIDLEFNGATNDRLIVTTPNGLTINGGGFNLYAEGTTNKFTTTGTYNLITFSGAVGGTSSWTSASILNPAPRLTYTFGTSGSFVTLTIGGQLALTGTWSGATNSSWNTVTNWVGSKQPNGAGDAAEFFGAAPGTVTLDGSKTVGTIEFNSASSYTITPGTGGSLTIDNTGFNALINDFNGSHTIAAPLTLNAPNTVITVTNAADLMTLSAAVSGTSGITKNGAGTLVLSASNSYSGGTTLNSGTTEIRTNSSLGTGSVTVTGTSSLRSTAGVAALANNIAINSAAAITVDPQANTLTLSGTITGSGGLVKSGSGLVVVAANNTYGATTITSGTMQVGTSGTTGSLGTGAVTNNGALVFNRSDTLTQTGLISGSGALAQIGSGTLILNAANTFSGDTTVTSGTIQLGNSSALQNSTLKVVTGGGQVSFGSLTSVTLGGLNGSQNLLLSNTAGAAVALAVGGNNVDTTYSGSLSGSSSFTKNGSGTMFLTGSSDFPGGITIASGTVEVGTGGALTTTGTIGLTSQTSFFHLNGGTVTAGLFSLENAAAFSKATIDSGTATFSSTRLGRLNGNADNNASVLTINGGTVSLGDYNSQRDGSGSFNTTTGLIINNGNVTANSVRISTNNGFSNATVNGGSLVIGGTASVNGFAVGQGTTNARGGNFTITGGTLTYSGSDGLVINSTTGSSIGQASFNGGTSTLAGITVNAATVSGGSATLNINGGLVYLGSVGLVQSSGTGASAAISTITLTSGTLGATADWNSAASMALAGTNGGITFRAADASNVAHNIALAGALSGSGDLTKTGGGTLTVSGTNSYSGVTTVAGGVLVAAADSALGTGNVSVLNTAINLTISTGVTNAIGDTATLSLAGGGAANTADFGYLLLNGNESVGSLLLGGVAQNPGKYGAPGSGAQFINSEYFSGPGILTVSAAVPEPGTWALMACGAGLLIGIQRTRRRTSR